MTCFLSCGILSPRPHATTTIRCGISVERSTTRNSPHALHCRGGSHAKFIFSLSLSLSLSLCGHGRRRELLPPAREVLLAPPPVVWGGGETREPTPPLSGAQSGGAAVRAPPSGARGAPRPSLRRVGRRREPTPPLSGAKSGGAWVAVGSGRHGAAREQGRRGGGGGLRGDGDRGPLGATSPDLVADRFLRAGPQLCSATGIRWGTSEKICCSCTGGLACQLHSMPAAHRLPLLSATYAF